jgi:cation diffusion facilitator family transporter
MTPSGSGSRSGRFRRDQEVNRVLWVVLALNLLVASLKLVFGYFSGAVSMLADGLHSTLDASSNVMGLVGMKVARKAPDEDHPYGHRKFEALAALGISLFLFIACYEVFTEVLKRFGREHELNVRAITFAVMIVTMIVNWFVSRYERRQGEKLRSMILLADSKHTQSDVFTSAGVLISLMAAVLNFPVLDLVIAVAISIFIAYSGYTILVEAFSVLSDSQMVDPEEVERLVLGVEGITRAHRIRSRGLPDDIHVDLHLHVSGDITVAQAHELAHEASERIRNGLDGVTDVVAHMEPEDQHQE